MYSTDERALQGVSGDHLDGKVNADVVFLSLFLSANLSHMSTNIESFFPNLRGISWYSVNLRFISAEDLKPFPNIVTFAVTTNKLVTIDGDLFKYTPKLQWIVFANNLIEHVGENLLTDLKDLVHVHFGNNVCIAFMANTPEALVELKQMLPVKCPPAPLTTTTILPDTSTQVVPDTTTTLTTTISTQPPQCSAECMERIEKLSDKVNEVSDSNKILSSENSELKQQLAIHQEIINQLMAAKDKLEERIVELEKQIREIGTNPCTPGPCIENKPF
jgi:hypothetical protein